MGSTVAASGASLRSLNGWGSGLLGVLIFSGSLPATRVAVAEFSPLFLTAARASIATLIGVAALALWRQPRPERRDWVALVIVAIGIVIGFPLLTALALEHITAARSILFIALLPLATALFGVVLGDERPRPLFWLFSGLGSATLVAYAVSGAGSADLAGDAFMIGAIVVCGLGYAEGARLSRRLGGWQVISWSLLVSAPVMLALTLATWPVASSWPGITPSAWIALAYVSIFSMFVGFVFWNRGLAIGGIAKVGQLQLLQPLIGLLLAALLLNEEVGWPLVGACALVVVCVAGARRFG